MGGCRRKFSKILGEGKCDDTGASGFFFVLIVVILTKCLTRIVSIQDHLMDAYLGVHGIGNWVGLGIFCAVEKSRGGHAAGWWVGGRVGWGRRPQGVAWGCLWVGERCLCGSWGWSLG